MSKTKGKALAREPKSKKNEKDSCEAPFKDRKIADAHNSKGILLKRTGRDRKTEEDVELDEENGKKIAYYLDKIVPDWEAMNATRLYSHLQNMLDKADEIRRFEIDLVWRRAIYLSPLFVIFFAAFGGVFHIIYGAGDTPICEERSFLIFVLVLIALVNAFLSFCLAMMNVSSRRWQRNWEYHVDYLQAILGVNMIRACLKTKPKYFTIGRTNILISIFMFMVWLSIAIIVLLLELEILISKDFLFPDKALLAIGITIVLILSFTFIFYKCFTGESFFKTNNAKTKEKTNKASEAESVGKANGGERIKIMEVRNLQNIRFKNASSNNPKKSYWNLIKNFIKSCLSCFLFWR